MSARVAPVAFAAAAVLAIWALGAEYALAQAAFAMLACDRLCHNRLPCAATARSP